MTLQSGKICLGVSVAIRIAQIKRRRTMLASAGTTTQLEAEVRIRGRA